MTNQEAGLIEETAKLHGDARIVVVGAKAYKHAGKLDYEMLTTALPTDGSRWWHYFATWGHYGRAKLANIYFTRELDRRLRERGVRNVYCNACHPGRCFDSPYVVAS